MQLNKIYRKAINYYWYVVNVQPYCWLCKSIHYLHHVSVCVCVVIYKINSRVGYVVSKGTNK